MIDGVAIFFIFVIYTLFTLTAYNYLEAYIHINHIKPNWWHVLAVFSPFNMLIVFYIIVKNIPKKLREWKTVIINVPIKVFGNE